MKPARKVKEVEGHPEWVNPEGGVSHGFVLVPPEGGSQERFILLDCQTCHGTSKHKELDPQDPETPKPKRDGCRIMVARAVCIKCGAVHFKSHRPAIKMTHCPTCGCHTQHLKVDKRYPNPPQKEGNNYFSLIPRAVCSDCGTVAYEFIQHNELTRDVVSLTDPKVTEMVREKFPRR